MLQSPPAAAAERKKRRSKQPAADAESEVDSETKHRSDAAAAAERRSDAAAAAVADHSVTITCPCDDQHNSVSFLSLYLPTHVFIKKGAGKPTRFFLYKDVSFTLRVRCE